MIVVNRPAMQATICAICGVEASVTELYQANFSIDDLTPAVFSARRLPDRIHYRLVRCDVCGLVRSDPIVPPAVLSQLYSQSTFAYHDEVDNLRRCYGKYLHGLEKYGVKKETLLEIGCGNGFFLEEALQQGYLGVMGVEPSMDAVERSNPQIRPLIVCNTMQTGLLQGEQFDVICMFQVLDHIPEPGELLDECFRLLRPGGLILCINHNIEAISARILREHSPIIDVEHTYLFGPQTLSRLFSLIGFDLLRIGPVRNIYSPHYIMRLLPLPKAIKEGLLRIMSTGWLRNLHMTVALGNIFLVAQKPNQAKTAEP
jgi:SAM-dependent methyltransferase